LAIIKAAGYITETAAGDIPSVTGTTAMTLFVRQPENFAHYNLNAHQPILLIFGTDIAE